MSYKKRSVHRQTMNSKKRKLKYIEDECGHSSNEEDDSDLDEEEGGEGENGNFLDDQGEFDETALDYMRIDATIDKEMRSRANAQRNNEEPETNGEQVKVTFQRMPSMEPHKEEERDCPKINELRDRVTKNSFFTNYMQGFFIGASSEEVVTVRPLLQSKRDDKITRSVLAFFGLGTAGLAQAICLGEDQSTRFCPCGAEHSTVCFFPKGDMYMPMCGACVAAFTSQDFGDDKYSPPSILSALDTVIQSSRTLNRFNLDWKSATNLVNSNINGEEDEDGSDSVSPALLAAVVATSSYEVDNYVDMSEMINFLVDFTPSNGFTVARLQ